MTKRALARLYKAIQDDDLGATMLGIGEVSADHLGGPLVLSVTLGRTGTVARLLETGADVHSFSSRGTTALHQAALVSLGKAEHAATIAIIPRLLLAGADPTVAAAKDARLKGSPLIYAASSGSPVVLALFLADERTHQPKILAAALEHAVSGFEPIEKVKLLLERDAKPSRKALHNACSNSDVAILLLEHGAPAGAADERGCTALHLAVAADALPLVKALVSRTEQSDAATTKAIRGTEIRKGDTPADLAKRRVRWHQQSAVEALLRAAEVRPGEVAAACAPHAPTVDGAWDAARDYCGSIANDAAADRLSEATFRSELPELTQQSLAGLANAGRILDALGIKLAPTQLVLPPGTWPLIEIDDSERGGVQILSKWLGGVSVAIEFREDGSFEGSLGRRRLQGTWEFADTRLVMNDHEQGELEAALESDSLTVIEWKNDGDLIRYTFARPAE